MTKKKIRTIAPAVTVVKALPEACECGEMIPAYVKRVVAIADTTNYSCVCGRILQVRR